MDTASNHKPLSSDAQPSRLRKLSELRGITWISSACALFVAIVTFTITLLAGQTGGLRIVVVVAISIVTTPALAALTFFGIRRLLSPQFSRVEQAVAIIESLVSEASVESGIVVRLEKSAENVATRLTELNKIENYRQEFLGDVSHELQTPIYAVQGFAETLLGGALEDPTVNRAFVEKILRHSERLSTLVNDLSHISQIETGSVKMDLAPFDARSLVNEAEESFEMTSHADGISLSTFIAPSVRYAVGDRLRIRQVLDNLISNGFKYNDEGGRVEITVRVTESRRVLFAVTDDGIGLAAEHTGRVTERFYRVDKSRSRERGGTGLGLAIVKHILEAHGSRLTINSTPGRGSTFSFSLDSQLHRTVPDVT